MVEDQAAAVEYEQNLCIRRYMYHVYREIWEAAVGETFECAVEPGNAHEKFAVAIEKDGIVIGHLPRKVSCVSALFLKRGGTINCTVTRRQRHSADLPQGGLEIPCVVIFQGQAKEIQKLKRVLKYIRL